MLSLLIVYAVLGAAVIALYLVSQRFRNGPRQGFWAWLKSGLFAGGRATPNVDSRALSAPTGHVDNATEVVAVLEDIYEEFSNESAKLRADMEARIAALESTWNRKLDDLLTEVRQLQQSVERYTNHSTAVEDVEVEHRLALDVSMQQENELRPRPSADEVYFSILDELHAGTPPVQIAAKLGVTLDEVARVREIMESPGITAEPH